MSVRDRVVTATASRRGVRTHNCDAAATFTAADGTTTAAVVEGIGNDPQIADMSHVLAEVIARTAARRGVLAALLTAGEVVADPGVDGDTPDAVAVVAVVKAGEETRIGWCGDSRVYGFDGQRVRQYSTDATVGEQLRRNGVALDVAAAHDNWLRTCLSQATIATAFTAYVPPDELVLLCTDGVVDGLPDGVLEDLIGEYADDPKALAEALVAATEPDADGYRDDATVVVLTTGPTSRG
ncbi:PP2C family protein-serine/threonine phosphatase [Thermomonospora umbrina]|uniref:Serine/threonine protein phosphatase PrpC n=1 Tax=Thermomonospora umbrina TaxID=111806 RepID=A0A3D9T1W1_9ACTN|nr:SpoIIE family protein phosphatase [Thermomonospora umbrina]REF00324.1 serine/threonine protein phosphatase PrpC [Thermomonospora umbrina]